jgi:hypothetical protein
VRSTDGWTILVREYELRPRNEGGREEFRGLDLSNENRKVRKIRDLVGRVYDKEE